MLTNTKRITDDTHIHTNTQMERLRLGRKGKHLGFALEWGRCCSQSSPWRTVPARSRTPALLPSIFHESVLEVTHYV
jgi:hypothetical protein